MSSSGFQATKLSDSTDIWFIYLLFKIVLSQLLLIHNVVRSYFFFFRPCAGSDTLFDKLWLVRLPWAAWQCVWLFHIYSITLSNTPTTLKSTNSSSFKTIFEYSSFVDSGFSIIDSWLHSLSLLLFMLSYSLTVYPNPNLCLVY